MSTSSRECLFCSDGIKNKFQVFHPVKETLLERKPEETLTITSPPWDTNDMKQVPKNVFHYKDKPDQAEALIEQLQSIFIVRKLLDISSEDCVQYLSSEDGGNSPSSWFDVCTRCQENVYECYQLHCQIAKLEKKFNAKKENLKQLIYQSQSKKTRRGRKKKNESILSKIRGEIWRSEKCGIFLEDSVTSSSSSGRTNTTPLSDSKSLNPIVRLEVKVELNEVNSSVSVPPATRKSLKRKGSKRERLRNSKRRKKKVFSKVTRNANTLFLGKAEDPEKGHLDEILEDPLQDKSLQGTDEEGAGTEYESLETDHGNFSVIRRSGRKRRSVLPHSDLSSLFEDENDDVEKVELDQEFKQLNPYPSSNDPLKLDLPTMRSQSPDSLNVDVTLPSIDLTNISSKLDREINDNDVPEEEDYAGDADWLPSPSPSVAHSPPFVPAPESDHNPVADTSESPSFLLRISTKEPKKKRLRRRKGYLQKQTFRYRCQKCPAKFYQSSSLKSHLKVHEDGNVETCPKCLWVCRKGLLLTHTKRKHPEVPVKEYTVAEKTRMRRASTRLTVTSIEDQGLRIPFYCDFCESFFCTEMKLIFHMKQWHPKAPWNKCPICDNKYMSKQQVQLHVERKHPGENLITSAPAPTPQNQEHSSGPVKCLQCYQEFPSILERDYHIAKNHYKHLRSRIIRKKKPVKPSPVYVTKGNEGIPLYCDSCHMIFIYEARLIRHTLFAHPGKLLPRCEDCGLDVHSKQLLQLHKEKKHPPPSPAPEPNEAKEGPSSISPADSNMKPSPCPHCPEQFRTVLGRDYHIAKMHFEKLLECKLCSFKGAKFFNLQRHMQTKHSEDSILCDLCSRTFRDQNMLTAHKTAEHFKELGLKPFLCKYCSCPYGTKIGLLHHEKFSHEKVKENFCEYCGKAFSRGCDLKNHLKLHTAPKEKQYKQGPFFCEFCNGKFNVRQALYYHLKRYHSEKFIYRCDACGKGYCFMATLYKHQRTCKANVVPRPSTSKEPKK